MKWVLLIIGGLGNFIIDKLKNVRTLAMRHWYMVVLDISFVVYYKINGGIVLGHKDFHYLCFHPAQLCYMILFFALFPVAFDLTLGLQVAGSVLQKLK
jgi:hypothetical protein